MSSSPYLSGLIIISACDKMHSGSSKPCLSLLRYTLNLFSDKYSTLSLWTKLSPSWRRISLRARWLILKLSNVCQGSTAEVRRNLLLSFSNQILASATEARRLFSASFVSGASPRSSFSFYWMKEVSKTPVLKVLLSNTLFMNLMLVGSPITLYSSSAV